GRGVAEVESGQPRPDQTGETGFDETRRKLYEISYMILDVYNAVGEYERPPCRCEDYRQELHLARQKLHGTLEANRALSKENERLRFKIEHQSRTQRTDGTGAAGMHDDLYRRMRTIETTFQQIRQEQELPPPPPPPKAQHIAKHMRSNLENKLDGKPSLRDRVKAALFDPGET
ncbi:hypothetical protein EV126DRAFT_334379, partial [Verticillium dahliae]